MKRLMRMRKNRKLIISRIVGGKVFLISRIDIMFYLAMVIKTYEIGFAF